MEVVKGSSHGLLNVLAHIPVDRWENQGQYQDSRCSGWVSNPWPLK